MHWKKVEDWFVESAAFVVARIICAVIGGGFVLLGAGFVTRSIRYGEGSMVERMDGAFYGYLVFAAIVAVIFAVAGPKLLHAIYDHYNDR